MNKLKVYHQCGHNSVWNIDVLENDNVGQGLIISPMKMKKDKIISLSNKIKKNSFFDPQFYWPRSTQKKLCEYDFFPNTISNGYETVDYEESSYESAKECVGFQTKENYKFIVIPTVYYEETPSNYLDILKSLYIMPFVEEIKKQETKKPILLSVVIKDIQLNDKEYRNELLNFITGINGIDGIYLIPAHKESSKRIKDIDYMYNLMTFIYTLKQNDMYVHIGYTDIENYIYTLTGADSVSIGVYENVRRFNIEDFKNKQENGHPNAPNRRIYSSKLFQWIDCNYLGALSEYSKFEELFENNKYKELMYKEEANWNLTQPNLYKHYLMSLYNQLQTLPNEYNKRYNYILKKLQDAINYNNEIKEMGILFDSESDGSHLNYWITTINRFNNFLKERA